MREEYRDPASYSWTEQALWIHQHLPSMRFTLDEKYDHVCIVWLEGDDTNVEISDSLMRIGVILQKLFGAYLSGPMCNFSLPGKPAHQGFIMWNSSLIENARRVFPLPENLQPGRPVFLGPQPSIEAWKEMDKKYDRMPWELPK